MLLLQETERALADKSSPKVIFLHMIGSHPNPCDRLNSWPNYYLEQYPRKIACYLASISKLDNFLGQLDGILRRYSRHFAMLYFSGLGLSVSHGIVSHMGGSLSVVNSDEGACFRVELPLHNSS